MGKVQPSNFDDGIDDEDDDLLAPFDPRDDEWATVPDDEEVGTCSTRTSVMGDDDTDDEEEEEVEVKPKARVLKKPSPVAFKPVGPNYQRLFVECNFMPE